MPTPASELVIEPASEPVIEIGALEKHYGKVRALDALTLRIQGGPVGILGPNGSGKTTLLKLLIGLLHPDAGRARVAGHDPTRADQRLALRRAVGYMPESDCLIPGMTGVELVSTLARLSGLTHADAITRAHEVLDYVGLDESRYRDCNDYSTGMKQRLKLAQALVHDPELLLLDEPTNGLDPKGRRHMLDLVHDLGHVQQKHVLVCSHLLPDVERTCRDVVVLRRGRLILSGSIAELTRATSRHVRIAVAGDGVELGAELARSGFAIEREPQGMLRVDLGAAGDADPLFEVALRARTSIVSIEDVRSSLEEVFLEGLAREDGA